MAFKDLETKRSLRKKYRDSKDQLKYTQKSLASTEQERDIANRRLEKTKAKLDKVTALYVAEKAKTQNLPESSKSTNHRTPKQSFLNVWGLKMPTTTRLFDEKNILRTLAKCLSNIKVGKYFELH